MTTLHIKSSILGENSNSSKFGEELIKELGLSNVIERDVVKHPVSILNMEALSGIGQKSGNIYNEHNMLIEEIKSVDNIVISSPMYNFNISAQLHLYIDAIVKSGETFHYDETGTPIGHLKDKNVYVVIARGGKYRQQGLTFQEDYLKTVLGFIGLTNIKFIFVEGFAMGLTKDEAQKEFLTQIK